MYDHQTDHNQENSNSQENFNPHNPTDRDSVCSDSVGRFTNGNSGGPGRPKRATEAEYLQTLKELCPLERWQRIIERALLDAEQGDAKARTWLGSYLIGKPKEISKETDQSPEEYARQVREHMRLMQAATLGTLTEEEKEQYGISE